MTRGGPALRFDLADAESAYREWGCNCGPTAVAAVLGRTLDEVRPHLGDFESKRYTNPTLMYRALRSLGATWVPIVRSLLDPRPIVGWPRLGLVRIQWEGPWTAPGVPLRARYRHTHWVGAATSGDEVGIWDCNALNNGSGWVALAGWESVVVPWILSNHPRATGRWHQTHVLDLVSSGIAPGAAS